MSLHKTVGLATRYRLPQEYITPHTPEENGMTERFFRAATEEVYWQHRMQHPEKAFSRFADWIDFYHSQRPC